MSIFLVLSGCGTPVIQPQGPADLTGQWESEKAEGKDAAFWTSIVKTTELRFGPDGSFEAVMVSAATNTPEIVNGTYQADRQSIRLNLQNSTDTKPAEYRFEGQSLVIQDPHHQYRVYYRRKCK
jgi:hypothetical protein